MSPNTHEARPLAQDAGTVTGTVTGTGAGAGAGAHAALRAISPSIAATAIFPRLRLVFGGGKICSFHFVFSFGRIRVSSGEATRI